VIVTQQQCSKGGVRGVLIKTAFLHAEAPFERWYGPKWDISSELTKPKESSNSRLQPANPGLRHRPLAELVVAWGCFILWPQSMAHKFLIGHNLWPQIYGHKFPKLLPSTCKGLLAFLEPKEKAGLMAGFFG